MVLNLNGKQYKAQPLEAKWNIVRYQMNEGHLCLNFVFFHIIYVKLIL